jgi:type IV pilus assembly protein PilQ
VNYDKGRERTIRIPRPATEAKVEIVPTTQPTTNPTRIVVNESELPMQTVELPDGKLRVIWTLRSVGGPGVTSSRDASTARRTVALTPADLAPLVAVLTAHVGTGGSVTPLPRENTIVITCEKAMKTSVIEMLSKLDVPQKQVEISAKIFEVSRDFDFQMGSRVLANRVASDNAQNVTSIFDSQKVLDAAGGGPPFQGSVISLLKTFQDQGLSIEASFQVLADAGLVRLVSSPRMTVAVGQTGYMLACQELPIQSANFVNNVLQTTTIYKPVGVQLYITPQAVGENRVKLHTISIVSSVAGFTSLPTLTGGTKTQGLLNPVIESREAETSVTVDNGDTLVISGLRMNKVTTRENKIPGLGDIPILGAMFKNQRSQQLQTDLYFFVTPYML